MPDCLGHRRSFRYGTQFFMQRTSDLIGTHVAQRDLDIQLIDVLRAEFARHWRQIGLVQAEPLELFLQHLAACQHVACTVQFVEPRTHLVARASADQEVVGSQQPVAAWFTGLGGEYLHPVATAQRMGERHDAAIDLGPTRAVPDHGVHVVGEVQHGATTWQVDHLALGRERVDAFLGKLCIQLTGQSCPFFAAPFARVFKQLPHPRNLAIEGFVAALALLVAPVRGNTQFGLRMHFMGTDLHFQRAPFRPDHCGVQRTVVVGLGPCDVVVELAGNGQP